MDFKISDKEKRWQPSGEEEVLKSNIFDLYPVFGNAAQPDIITDLEVLTGDEEQLKARCAFAILKQRGADPTDATSGSQWEEYAMGEIPAAVLINQINSELAKEGAAGKVHMESRTDDDGKNIACFVISAS